MNGFLCVLKPPGMTSSDVVVTVRRKMTRKEKVGHAGTLDPEACGVLPVMIGKASRLFDYIVEKEKIYIAQLKPGYATDTQDAQGRIIRGEGRGTTREALEAVLPQFTGTIMQVPPMYSALKRDGRKLCDLARAGETVEVAPREAQIFEIRIREELEDGSFLIFVRCGRGTYIRTLVQDIGDALGCCAHMGYLLRAQTGIFALEDAHTIEEIVENEQIESMLLPMDAPLGHLPRVDILPAARRMVENGNAIPKQLCGAEDEAAGPLRAYLESEFVGIAHWEKETLRFDAMLWERTEP